MNFKELVIGGTTEAFVYAFNNHLPIISHKNSRPPNKFDRGGKSHKLWHQLQAYLGFSGLVPFGADAEKIEIESQTSLAVHSNRAKLGQITFEKLQIFEEEGIIGLPEPTKELTPAEKEYLFVDWMRIFSEKHNYDFLESYDDLVRRLEFYFLDFGLSKYYKIKGAVAFSYPKGDQLESFDFSEAYVRLKTIQMLSDAGIPGPYNKDYKPRRDRLDALVAKREIYCLSRNIYADTETIKFNYSDSLDLIEPIDKIAEVHRWILRHKRKVK